MFIILSIIWKFLVLTIQGSRQGQGNSALKSCIEVTESVWLKKWKPNLVNSWCLSLLLPLDLAHEQVYARIIGSDFSSSQPKKKYLKTGVLNDTLRTLHRTLLLFPLSFPETMLIHLKVITLSELYMRIIYGFSISIQKGLSTTYVSGLSLAFDRSGCKYVNYWSLAQILRLRKIYCKFQQCFS